MVDIIGYEGLYAITSCGKVYSHRRGKFLKDSDSRGYRRIVLSLGNERKAFNIHRLVAEAYLPNPNCLPYVNHKDENKSNNSVNNLEWCSVLYNNTYGNRHLKCAQKISESRKNYFKKLKRRNLNNGIPLHWAT